MPEMTTISTTELTDLKVRVKKLATDKSYLQLIIRLMNRVNAVPGLDNTVETMLKNVVDVIGGTNIILYYVIDSNIYYADVYGERKKLDSVADSLVKKVMETRESIEFEHEFSDTQMITPEFSKAYTWIVPLLVGEDLVGVFKMESLNIAMRDLYQQLPTFFAYVALVLKNEILGHTRLKQAYDRIEQEMVVRQRAEDELRQANESLEERVTERTVELRNANEQLGENEQQIKSLLDKSEQSRRTLLSILEDEKQVKAALQRERALLSRIMETSPVGITMVDRDGQVTFANSQTEKVLSLTKDTITQRMYNAPEWSITDYDGNPFPDEELPFQQVMSTGQPVHDVQHAIVWPDGRRVLLSINGAPLLNEAGEVESAVCTIEDVTERKQAEMALQRLNRELRAISNCNQILMRAVDEQILLNDICRIVCDEAGYRMAWVGYAENDESKTVRPAAWAGTEGGYLATADITWADTEHGRGPTGTAIRSGESINIQDFLTDPQVSPWRDGALQRGYRSNIALPLKDESAKTFGVLNIYSTEPNAFTPDEIRLLDELAGDLAFGIGVLRARAERKRMEEALQESGRHYRQIVDLSQDMIVIHQQGKVVFINEAGVKLVGASMSDQIIGRSVLDFVPPSRKKVAQERMQSRLAESEGKSPIYEQKLLRFDGTERDIDVRGMPIRYLGGDAIQFVARDITERKRAEDALRESETKFRAVFENSVDAIGVSKAGIHTFVNPAYLALFGYADNAELNEKTILDLIAPSHREQILENVRRHASGQPAPAAYETRGLRKDGSEFDMDVHMSTYELNGEIYSVPIIRDITERKQAEESLRKSETQLNEAQRIAHLGSWQLDIVNDVLSWSDEIYRMFEIDPERFGASYEAFLDAIHPDDRDAVNSAYTNSLKTRIPYVIDHRLQFADGRIKYVHEQCETFYDADGKPIRSTGTVQDITERKQAEEALQESEKKFRNFIEQSSEGFTLVDEQGVVIEWNHAREKMTGLPASQVIGKTLWDIQYQMFLPELKTSDRHERNRQITLDALQTGQSPIFDNVIEAQVMRHDGKLRFVQQTVFPIKTDKGYRIGSVTSDITERKRAEDALRESEIKFRAVFENSVDAIGVSKAGMHTFVNPAYLALFGYADNAELNEKTILDLIAPSHREQILENVRRHASGQPAPAAYETRGQRKDGSEFDMDVHVSTYELNGEIYSVPIIRDITERKRAEENLRVSEEKYRVLAENIPNVVFQCRNDSRYTFVYLNSAIEKLTGYSKDDFLEKGFSFFDLYHPDDLKAMPTPKENNITDINRNPFHITYRIRHKSGEWRWVDEWGTGIMGSDGKVEYLEGIMVDITERKRNERELIILNHAINQSSDAVFLINEQLTFAYANDAACHSLGYTREELLTMRPSDIDAVITYDAAENIMNEQFANGHYPRFETQHKTRDGRIFPVEISSSVVEYDGVKFSLTTARDITERKQAEAEIQALARFPSENPNPVLRVTQDGILLYANPASVDLMRCWNCSVGERLPEFWRKLVLEALNFSLPQETEVACGERLFALTFAPIKESGYVNLYGRDITEYKRAEEALHQSEERFRRLAENARDVIYRMSLPDGKYEYVSPAALSVFGYSTEECYKTPILIKQAIHPNWHKYFEEQWANLIKGEMPPTYEYQFIHKSGEVRWLNQRNILVRDDAGTPIAIEGIVTDITERKQAENALRESEWRYRDIFDNVLDGLYLLDVAEDGRFRTVEVNPALEKMTGVPRSFSVGKTQEETVSEETVFIVNAKYRRCVEAGHPIEEDVELDLPVGRRYFHSTLIPARDETGRISRIIGISHDITERKQAEQDRLAHLRFIESMDQINRAIQETSDLEQMMGDVLGIVLSIFDCDRAYIVYPCDPEATSYRVPMEQTKPEYPGAFAKGIEVPVDAETIRVFKTLMGSDNPVTFGPGSESTLPSDLTKYFGIQSQVAMAVYPKIDKPYMFGLHQCSYPRVWTAEEERLLQEIGRRLGDALTSLLTHRNLQESEQRYRMVFENSPVSIWEEDFSGVKALLDDLKKEGVTDIETYFTQHPETLRQCADLAKIVDVNQAALTLHAAANKEELLAGLVNTFTPESFDAFQQELVCLWNGETEMIRDSVVKTLAGAPRKVSVYFSVCPGYEQTLSKVLVSLANITERKQAEEALLKSEAGLKEAQRLGRLGSWDWDARTDVITWSEEYYRIYGLDPSQPPPEYVEHLKAYTPESAAQLDAAVKRNMETGEAYALDLELVRADAPSCWITARSETRRDANDQIVGLRGTAQDITERKQAEEEIARSLEAEKKAREIAEILREANESLSRALNLDDVLQNLLQYLSRLVPYDSANVMLLEGDFQLRVVAQYGYERWADADMTRKIAFDIRTASILNELVATQKSVLIADTREYPGWIRPVGAEHVISWLGIPIVADRQVIGLYSVDKTEPGFFTEEHCRLAEGLAGQAAVAIQNTRLHAQIKRANIELEQRILDRTAELEVANKELEAFAYSVSHDLRAPLRHIDGFIEMLQNRTKTTLDDKSQHYMMVIVDSARKMGTLIDDLLSFSRMGRNEMFKSQVDLNELVQDVIQESKSETEGRNVQWKISPLPLVTGDRAMLRIVLVNLISNALKFTHPRKTAQIEIGYEKIDETEVVIFIRDNGVGFDMNYADKLFGVFQRLHRQEDFEGTGIGLANVRRVISRHGGRTWADGQVDHGATFYFSLPTPHLKIGDTHEDI